MGSGQTQMKSKYHKISIEWWDIKRSTIYRGLLADLADRFHYLKVALAFILTFIGVKMLLPLAAEGYVTFFGADGNSAFGQFVQRYQDKEFGQTIINISLGVVVGAIALAIICSIIFPPSEKVEKDLSEE